MCVITHLTSEGARAVESESDKQKEQLVQPHTLEETNQGHDLRAYLLGGSETKTRNRKWREAGPDSAVCRPGIVSNRDDIREEQDRSLVWPSKVAEIPIE